MLSMHSIGIVVLGAMLASKSGSTTELSFDECLRTIRTGPDSFLPYLCLGTPGLPEHASDVRVALTEVLSRKPREPHARIYLALMDTYALKKPGTAEFTEPLAALEGRGVGLDFFFARLALLE